MFENQEIAAIEGKCRRFRDSSKFLHPYVIPRYFKTSFQINASFYLKVFDI